MLAAPLGLSAALESDGCECLGEHLPSTTGNLEAITELRVHELAKFWVHVVALEDGQNFQLQLCEIDVGNVGQSGGSRHERRA